MAESIRRNILVTTKCELVELVAHVESFLIFLLGFVNLAQSLLADIIVVLLEVLHDIELVSMLNVRLIFGQNELRR